MNKTWNASNGSTPFLFSHAFHPCMPIAGAMLRQDKLPGVEEVTKQMGEFLDRATACINEARANMKARADE